MISNIPLKGITCNLRSVRVDDAYFILSLRLDNKLNRYLNKVKDDLLKQKQWISNQLTRDNDYYFIIEDNDGVSLGTISLYNVKSNEAEFGRWVSRGGALVNIESVILLHKFGFNSLNLDRIYSKTVADNFKVLNFHKRFGATVTQEITCIEPSGFKLQTGYINKDDFEEIENKNILIIKEIYAD